MNLAAYDKVDNKIDKTKTWLDHNNKRIVSKQIKYRTYYAFGKRYNPNTDKEEFYLITSDNIVFDRNIYHHFQCVETSLCISFAIDNIKLRSIRFFLWILFISSTGSCQSSFFVKMTRTKFR